MTASHRLKALLIACAAAASLIFASASGRVSARDGLNPQPTLYASQSAQSDARAEPAHTINVSVTDESGAFVKGLGRERFTILDGGQPREIVSFAEEDVPATVGILLDASPSMVARGMNPTTVSEALRQFFRHCNPSDEFFLTAFNQSPQMLLDISDDPAAVLSALDKLTAPHKGQTALYDAVYLALSHVSRGKHQRRVLLLISDGQDTVSHYSFSELRRQLKESDVTIYAIGIVSGGESQLDYAGRAILEELAGVSGGKAFFISNPNEFYESMVMVSVELQLRYTIGFASAPSKRKDGWHEVKVKVDELNGEKGKKIKTYARTREGFYDPPRH